MRKWIFSLFFGKSGNNFGQDAGFLRGFPMNFVLQPWQLFLAIFVGWVNEDSRRRIDFLQTALEVVTEASGTKRILLNDDQRRRLAVKGKLLGRKTLAELCWVFSPDTILRWHRQLIAQKWTHTDKRKSVGRPSTPKEVVDLILQFAR